MENDVIDRIVAYVCAVVALVLAIIPTPKPEPVFVDRYITRQLFGCDKQSFREHVWMCATRKRMEDAK